MMGTPGTLSLFAMLDGERPEKRYRVVDFPGPGLANIADRETGRVELWSRTRVRSRVYFNCANCGSWERLYYRPPEWLRVGGDRLCVMCVEGVPHA